MNDYGKHWHQKNKDSAAPRSKYLSTPDGVLQQLCGDRSQQQKNMVFQQKQQQQYQRQPQQQLLRPADEVKIKWQQNFAAAKEVWGKLSDDELLESEGNSKKLSALVSDRYAIPRDEADKLVDNFLNKFNSC